MDDMITGFDDVITAIKMYHELKIALKKGGFNIRKFVSNSLAVMEQIPEVDRETKINNKTKTLGIRYESDTDEFSYELNYSQELSTA